MAGGEGTRLRPMTSGMPKPLLPVVNRPVMEHVLRLLRRHGFTEVVVTVQFLASLVRNYFGDGEELGMALTYATEEEPLGTAGSVKNAEAALADETFLVISGDALTDIDLTALVEFHREKHALVTVCLTRVSDPLEFGITIVDDHGRVQRFLEKPTWGQVFTDTVNTGIYVMEPEVFDYVAAGQSVDWSGEVLPRLIEEGRAVYGYIADGYWEDIGTLQSYHKAHADVLEGRVEVDIDGFEIAPGVWVAEGAEVDPQATLKGPLYVGDYAKVEAGAELREYTVLGSNVVVRSGAFLHRAVVHDNVFIGQQANLRGCVVGKNTDVMRAVRIDEGAVVGEECILEEEAIISTNVKVYPFKTIEAGAVIHSSVIWEARGQRSLFGARGVTGIINVEITPELVVRLTSAYATTLNKGATVVTSRDHSRAARAFKRAVISALTSSALNVRDLETVPPPVARMETSRAGAAGGIMLRTQRGVPDSVQIVFLDDTGADLSPAGVRKLERIFQRQEFRRAFPGEIGDLSFPPRAVESYVQELQASISTRDVETARLKVVIDTAGGVSSLVVPSLLARLPIDVLTVNNRLDDNHPTELAGERAAGMRRLGELVASSKAAFGVRFDPIGERLSIVDDTGRAISDERALLVFLDLVAAERGGGRVALPVTTTRIAEQVCRFHGVEVLWTTTAADPYAAFVRLLGLVARTQLSLSQIDGRIPHAHVVRRDVPTPWAHKGQVMRAVLESAGDREVDTTDGVRVVEDDGSWVLVLPDPAEAVTRLWAEARTDELATGLLDQWTDVVDKAGR